MPKRAPSGFMGMRGKRLFDDDREQLIKRAPSGFLGIFYSILLFYSNTILKNDEQKGMRGKKGSDDILRQLENLENLKQGLNDYDWSLYESQQNERQLLNELVQLYSLEPEYLGTKLEPAKRAPSNGFFGMRGKKNAIENEVVNDYDGKGIDKRAPSTGFFGMRGKKDVDDELAFNVNKRAPMGFQG